MLQFFFHTHLFLLLTFKEYVCMCEERGKNLHFTLTIASLSKKKWFCLQQSKTKWRQASARGEEKCKKKLSHQSSEAVFFISVWSKNNNKKKLAGPIVVFTLKKQHYIITQRENVQQNAFETWNFVLKKYWNDSQNSAPHTHHSESLYTN